MKKISIISLIVTILILIAIPISIASIGFIIPPQFNETYYGELPYMFDRLKKAKDSKIVIVGNSSIAFGVRSDIIQKELNKETVTFGLYGAIGTKAMMDLSKVGIKNGDIVILAPEISEQGLSLYFSAENMWMAVDGRYDLLNYIAKDNRQAMVGNFPYFASKKYDYFIKGKKPELEGVYMQSSFNLDNQEVGYMTYYRDHNTMLNGYDSNGLIDFNTNYLSDEFVDYVNEYNDYVNKKGAKLYYGFVPMNNRAIVSSLDNINNFYDLLKEKLNCPILGHVSSYFYDFEWFYDNNAHLNSSGVYIYNKCLIDDLKIVLEDSSITNIDIPEKPDIPFVPYEEGDDTDAQLFEYEEYSSGYKIAAIKEEGRERNKIVVPSTYNDKPVVAFDVNTFINCANLNELTISKNIRSLPDNGFIGCNSLSRLVLLQENPNNIGVGTALLDGAPNCTIYVKEKSYDNYVNNYNWAYYRNKIKTY